MAVVLVHGSFLGPWSWRDVVADLEGVGIACSVADLPSGLGGIRDAAGDLHDDAARVRELLDAATEPVVLCGHSYGGAVITEAAAGHPAVRRLVYLAGAMPDAGQSLTDLAPPPVVGPGAREAVQWRVDGLLELTADSAWEALFHDCSAARAEEAISLLRPSNPVISAQGVRAAAWREVPATFVRGVADRMPELVSGAVEWDVVEVVELPTGHCPNWSRPDLVAALLADLAGSL
ncbi:alpha/beta fold hydrolase [Saccharopolyspora elongata]|uniref:Alpha/beta hydrolase n=1 Tax=Saccharopolyspora elongata TaxID=2530387 RepID=A0A4R4YFJ1_9PSEU|nr:alpha/beta hydrolase [Saccharopolyspora elongata]TDD42940.1 alpha/beta hydrolase [Saccharopolyspora elongata]